MVAIPIFKAVLAVLFAMLASSFGLNFYQYNELPATWKLVAWVIIGLVLAFLQLDEYQVEKAQKAAKLNKDGH